MWLFPLLPELPEQQGAPAHEEWFPWRRPEQTWYRLNTAMLLETDCHTNVDSTSEQKCVLLWVLQLTRV